MSARMKKSSAAFAMVLLLAACSESPTAMAPTDAALSKGEAGAPLGKGNCNPKQLRETQSGQINPGSCLFNEETGRRSAYFTTETPAEGSMLSVTLTAGFRGVFGIKQEMADPAAGIVWGSLAFVAEAPRRLAFVGSSPRQQLFVSGFDGGERGAFQLDARVEPVSYTCGIPVVMEAPVRFAQTLDAGHACLTTIRFSPFPEAIGKPLLTQGYNARLLPGASYEIRVEGVSPQFPAGLTVFKGGRPVAQSVGPVPADGVRSVVVTSNDLGYFYIEVSSATSDGNGGWDTPAGSYVLSVAAL